MKRIGIDVGGVIIGSDTDEADQFFTKHYLSAPPVIGSIETIKWIVSKLGADNVFIVSKCGENVQRKTRNWLEHNKFYEITGVSKENVFFCLERHEKKGICDKNGINMFIDDRFSVLEHMIGADKLFLFRPGKAELYAYFMSDELNSIQLVESWAEVRQKLSE